MVASFIRRISFENGDISESILGEMRLCSRAMKWFSDRLLDKSRPGDAFDEQFCGGTLIDKDSVLTAAHCLLKPKPDKLEVVVGRTALNQNRGQLRSVSRRFIHPRYNGNGYGYDAAILKLSRPVKSIKPIKLAT